MENYQKYYKNGAVLSSSYAHFMCWNTTVCRPEATILNSHLLSTRTHSILFPHPKKGGEERMRFYTLLGWNYLNFITEDRLLSCLTYMQDVIDHNIFFLKPRTLTHRPAFPIFHAQYRVLHLFSNNTEPSANVCCKFRTGEKSTFHVAFLLQD